VNGQWTIDDDALLSIARAVQMEGKLSRVFLEGGVTTPEDLVEMFKKPSNLPVFAFRDRESIGFGWLNGLAGDRAFAHFCMLEAARGREALRAMRLFLSYWMSLSAGGEPIFDTLLGVIPAVNERAIRFVEKCGCVRVGEIPQMMRDAYTGERVSAIILYYSRVNHGRR
jgi:hypothetical protein